MKQDELTELDFADPLDWVYEVRRRISEQYGHSIELYMKDMAERTREEEAKGRVFVRLPIVRRQPVIA